MKHKFYIKGSGEGFGKLNKQLTTIRAQRDKLLEALEDVTMALEAICAPESMAEIYAKEGRELIKELKP